MFENILGQNEATGLLRASLERGELPGSLLFDGPDHSAKASTALELARALSCEHEAAWNCACQQCRRHRALTHQDILILGPKSFREELAIGAAMMERAPGTASRYFFIRAARKLLRRFDRELYEGEEERLTKALPLVRTVLEGIDACSPPPQGPAPGRPQEASPGSPRNAATSGEAWLGDADAAKEARKLLASCARLEDMLPAATPVFQIRALEFWARLAPYGKRKTIIVEHADRMLDSSRNALLKILEEPPAHAVFVLTTSRRQAMIPTILSRVRRYRFIQRTGDEARLVLERIFKDKENSSRTVGEYIAGFRPSESGIMEKQARAFAAALAAALERRVGLFTEPALASLAARGGAVQSLLAEAAAASANFGASDDAYAWTFAAFLDAAGATFTALLRQPGAGTETQRIAERYAELARDAAVRHASYNLQPVALAERLADAFTNGSARDPASSRSGPRS